MSVFKIQEGAPPKTALEGESEEAISEDDFVEEEIADEIVESAENAAESQVFSVHDGKSKKTESVGDLPTSPKQMNIQGGNSTVNMGSVVPQAVPNVKRNFHDSKAMTQNAVTTSDLAQNRKAGSLLKDA